MFAAGLGLAQQPAPVKVEDGLVQGTSEDGLTVYRGIPFAAPPVGDLRWRAPQPAAKWDGVRQADKFAPMPHSGFGNPPAPGMSEDCLYLNVWTPAKSASDRIPVLVWIYGGGFSGGSTSDPNYSGEKLAKKGVVLVSIAYRVGQLGFLAHPELSAETTNHVSGNYGLLDMIAGLQWVQKNIAAFGGDPNKVTIFGESAGGIAVSMLCASPLAKGLFHGAISQSGGSFGPPRPTTFPGENLKRLADAERAGEAYAKSAGASSIAELRKTARRQTPGGPRSGHGLADHRWLGDSRRSIQALRGQADTTTRRFWWATTPTKARASRRRKRRRITSPASRSVTASSRTDLIKAYPVGTEHGSQNRARPDARCGVRLAHVDLGAASGEDRKIQGLLLLFRSASGLSGRVHPGPDMARRTARMWPMSSSISIPRIRRPRNRIWRSRRPWPPTGRTSPSTAIPTAKAFPRGRPSATPIRQ